MIRAGLCTHYNYEARGSQTVRQAWQALTPYYHAPAIYCRALPLILQLAVAATSGRALNECSVW
eukprot:1182283-Pleurochrysis_carterae.AAC.1